MIDLQAKGAKRPIDWVIWQAIYSGEFYFGIYAKGVLWSVGATTTEQEATKIIRANYTPHSIALVVPKENVVRRPITRSIGRQLGIHRIDATTLAIPTPA